MKKEISLSEHFTFGKIFRFVISPILMMVFTSLYGIVDGFFISNYAGLNEFAGVNLIMPVIMIIGGVGFIFGTGGSALVGKLLGEGDKDRANKVFSMVIKIGALTTIIVSQIGFFFIRPICEALGSITNGSNAAMVEEAIKYGRVLCLGQVFFSVQATFHSFFLINEKPKLAFIVTLLAGCTNIVLDYLFIAVFKWGTLGAAAATIIGCMVGSITPLIYFANNKKGVIYLTNAKVEWKPILQTIFNGSSEFVNNVSSSVVGLVFNIQLLKYFGQNGVSAYGTLMYVGFVFASIFIGYSIGVSPIVSYHYGAKNYKELTNILLKSFIVMGIISALMVLVGELAGPLFAKLFLGKDESLLAITVDAFKIYSLNFVFCGLSIFMSCYFTALNNGVISAIIAFLRTIVFQVGFAFILPPLIGGDGIWYSVVISELSSFILGLIFLFANKNKYHYFEKIEVLK